MTTSTMPKSNPALLTTVGTWTIGLAETQQRIKRNELVKENVPDEIAQFHLQLANETLASAKADFVAGRLNAAIGNLEISARTALEYLLDRQSLRVTGNSHRTPIHSAEDQFPNLKPILKEINTLTDRRHSLLYIRVGLVPANIQEVERYIQVVDQMLQNIPTLGEALSVFSM